MVGHIEREQTDTFLEEITRHAPWEVWAEKLAARKRPEPIHKLITATDDCPLNWSATSETSERSLELLEWLFHLRRRPQKDESPSDWTAVISEWLEQAHRRPIGADQAIESLAWAHALPRLAPRTLPEIWSALFAELVNVAIDAEHHADRATDADDTIRLALLGGELPLTLAYVFPKIELCDQLAATARKSLEDTILSLTDGEGMLHARLAQHWRQLLACWTRCFYIDRKINSGRISKEARLQYEWFVRQSIRWSRGDGSFLLAQDGLCAPGLLEAAVAVGGDRVDRDLFEIHRDKLKADASEFALPQPGEGSEWSELAVLRSAWSGTKATCLGVIHGGQDCLLELSVQGTLVWSGNAVPEIRFNQANLEPAGNWEQLLWLSDDDVDYLELELPLANGWQLQRQLMLARNDGFLWMADAVLGSHAGQIDYRLTLPLNGQIQAVGEEETTEVQLFAPRSVGWGMPVALCEWKTDRRHGIFDGRVLQQTDHGARLYAPIFWDLDPARRRKPRTWRQLTVAEQLTILPRDLAVAYRVQIGEEQWAFYRSLGPCGNRTFLGQNLISEFLAARFNRDGDTEPLIEVERDTDEG